MITPAKIYDLDFNRVKARHIPGCPQIITHSIYNNINRLSDGVKYSFFKVDHNFYRDKSRTEFVIDIHYHLDYPALEDLEACIAAFGELGLQVIFTELDINVLPKPSDYVGADVGMGYQLRPETNPYPDALPDSMQTTLANRYADFFKIFIKHKEIVSRVTFWGIHDGQSWKNNWPIRGRTNYPLLFDREYQPKKAFWEVVELAEKK